jgi:hypothetical protein
MHSRYKRKIHRNSRIYISICKVKECFASQSLSKKRSMNKWRRLERFCYREKQKITIFRFVIYRKLVTIKVCWPPHISSWSCYSKVKWIGKIYIYQPHAVSAATVWFTTRCEHKCIWNRGAFPEFGVNGKFVDGCSVNFHKNVEKNTIIITYWFNVCMYLV